MSRRLLFAMALLTPAHAFAEPNTSINQLPSPLAPTGPRITITTEPVAHAAPISHVIYLERCRGGCAVTKSNTNDAQMGLTILPQTPGTSTLSEFQNKDGVAGADADAEWNQLVACVKEVYSPYDVEVTDVKPSERLVPPGDRRRQSAGGRPRQRHPRRRAARAELRGVRQRDLVHVRQRAPAEDHARHMLNLCWTAAQESAHAFGLDHEFEFLDGKSACNDPMTYRSTAVARSSFATRPRSAARLHREAVSLWGDAELAQEAARDVRAGHADVRQPDVDHHEADRPASRSRARSRLRGRCARHRQGRAPRQRLSVGVSEGRPLRPHRATHRDVSADLPDELARQHQRLRRARDRRSRRVHRLGRGDTHEGRAVRQRRDVRARSEVRRRSLSVGSTRPRSRRVVCTTPSDARACRASGTDAEDLLGRVRPRRARTRARTSSSVRRSARRKRASASSETGGGCCSVSRRGVPWPQVRASPRARVCPRDASQAPSVSVRDRMSVAGVTNPADAASRCVVLPAPMLRGFLTSVASSRRCRSRRAPTTRGRSSGQGRAVQGGARAGRDRPVLQPLHRRLQRDEGERRRRPHAGLDHPGWPDRRAAHAVRVHARRRRVERHDDLPQGGLLAVQRDGHRRPADAGRPVQREHRRRRTERDHVLERSRRRVSGHR